MTERQSLLAAARPTSSEYTVRPEKPHVAAAGANSAACGPPSRNGEPRRRAAMGDISAAST